jgi:hypothetical protein
MPQWYPSKVKLVQVNEGNTYTQKVVEGEAGQTSGKVRVCGHGRGIPGNCVKADVVVGVPPCTVPSGSNQGCASDIAGPR